MYAKELILIDKLPQQDTDILIDKLPQDTYLPYMKSYKLHKALNPQICYTILPSCHISTVCTTNIYMQRNLFLSTDFRKRNYLSYKIQAIYVNPLPMMNDTNAISHELLYSQLTNICKGTDSYRLTSARYLLAVHYFIPIAYQAIYAHYYQQHHHPTPPHKLGYVTNTN